MKKRILDYRNRIDRLLVSNDEETDWNAVMEEHLIQIGFFQHERLIHLLVTLTFAILQIFTVYAVFVLPYPVSISFAVLTVMILCLLTGYIMHYYLLENSVQKMYHLRDDILAELKKRS